MLGEFRFVFHSAQHRRCWAFLLCCIGGYNRRTVEEAQGQQRRRGAVRTLMETFAGYRRHIALLAVLGFLSAFLDGIGISAIVPLLSFLLGGGEALPGDFITSTLQSAFSFIGIPFQFRYLLVFIAALFVLRAIALVVFTYIRARIQSDFLNKEMSYLLSATFASRWEFLLQQKAGYLQNTIYWDVKRTAGLLDVLVQFIQSGSGCVVYVLVALNISPGVTLATIGVGACVLLFFRPLVRKTQTLSEHTSTIEKDLSHHVTEHLAGLKSVKAAGAEQPVVMIGKKYLLQLQDFYAKSTIVQSLGVTLIQPFSFLYIMVLFAVMYATSGVNLAAFAAALYLIQKIFMYLQSGQAALHSISDMTPYANNVFEFKKRLQGSKEERSGVRDFVFEHILEFKDICFFYSKETPILEKVSFAVPKGATVALIGPSGAGKTSVADLLLRLFDPATGDIVLDGVSAKEISINSWREHIGYVSQDSFLINASIAENIRFYREDISDAAIEAAAKQANIYEFISSLSDGFNTTVGDRGVMLSGGQRQRVAFARAMARQPKLLVLDEATSALDTQSEKLIQEAIQALHGKTTVFVIAHRLSTIENADRVLVLEQGRIIEQGSPAELLANPNSYFTLHAKTA